MYQLLKLFKLKGAVYVSWMDGKREEMFGAQLKTKFTEASLAR